MKIKKTLALLVFFVVIWSTVCAVRPFWKKYWLGQEIKTAAIYGTKNGVEETRRFLAKKMREQRRRFSGEDFIIEKDHHNNVAIAIDYTDEIRIFGVTVTALEFTVETTASEVNTRF